jgi:hypothetical protein
LFFAARYLMRSFNTHTELIEEEVPPPLDSEGALKNK